MRGFFHWHRFIDHIAFGKEVESFFSSLEAKPSQRRRQSVGAGNVHPTLHALGDVRTSANICRAIENHDDALEHDEGADPVSVVAIAALEAILATAS